MDNLTHTLTGLALSRAGLNRFYARPTLVLLVASNIPDVDVFSLFGGWANYLAYHRGLTHSLAFMPVMAIFPALLALAISRSTAGWKAAYLISLVGVAGHLLLDWTNAYGIRLLLPFSSAWLHADLNSIVDIWIWAILLVAAFGPVLSGLVSAEIGAKPGSGQGLAIFALIAILIYDSGKYVLHQRAVDMLNSRIYEGGAPVLVGAFPDSVNPVHWVGWANTSATANRFDINVLLPFDPASGTKYYKAEPSPAIDAAKNTRPFRVLDNFSQYPLWSVEPIDVPEGGKQVQLRDERFPFTATAAVDKTNRVVNDKLQF